MNEILRSKATDTITETLFEEHPQSLPRIVCVAVRYQIPRLDPLCPEYGPIIFSAPRPARHHHIVTPLSQLNSGAALEGEQGFLTSMGQFIDRQEAMALAKRNGQLIKQHQPNELFSEDLW